MKSGYSSVFRISSFRSFWLGFTFSAMGDAITYVALIWIVYKMTASSEDLGILLLFYTGPVIVGGLVAGSLLDRFDRRKVMIADNLVRGTAIALVPILNALDILSLWEIYSVALTYGFFYMITLAGAPSIIPDLVREEHLSTANSLETISFTVSGVLGPPIAGLLIPQIGAPDVMVIDALSYGVFVLALSRLRLPPRDRTVGGLGSRSYSMKDAFVMLRRNKILLSTTLMFMSFNFGEGFLFLWLPILSTQVFHGGSVLYGSLLGAFALGQVAGALLGGSLISRYSLGKLICLAQGSSGLSLALILFNRSILVAVLSLVLLGLFTAPLTIWAQTLRMKIIPEELRGRVFALLRTLMQSASPTGSVVAGFLYPIIGLYFLEGVSIGCIGIPGLIGYGVEELRQEMISTQNRK